MTHYIKQAYEYGLRVGKTKSTKADPMIQLSNSSIELDKIHTSVSQDIDVILDGSDFGHFDEKEIREDAEEMLASLHQAYLQLDFLWRKINHIQNQ